MNIYVPLLVSQARCAGITLTSDLKLLPNQGALNTVYRVSSSVGDLVVHLGQHPDRSIRFWKAQRICMVSASFSSTHGVSVPRVMFQYKQGSYPVTVHAFIPGTPLHHVRQQAPYVNTCARFLAHLHKTSTRRYGFLRCRTGTLRGQYRTWHAFLTKSAFSSLRTIYRSRLGQGQMTSHDVKRLKAKLKVFFAMYARDMQCTKPRLLHGDFSFGNILVQGKKVSGIIDWEWSLSGDPAYEFAGFVCGGSTYESWYKKVLQQYMNEDGCAIDDQESFWKRIQLYWIIKILLIGRSFRDKREYIWTITQLEHELDLVLAGTFLCRNT